MKTKNLMFVFIIISSLCSLIECNNKKQLNNDIAKEVIEDLKTIQLKNIGFYYSDMDEDKLNEEYHIYDINRVYCFKNNLPYSCFGEYHYGTKYYFKDYKNDNNVTKSSSFNLLYSQEKGFGTPNELIKEEIEETRDDFLNKYEIKMEIKDNQKISKESFYHPKSKEYDIYYEEPISIDFSIFEAMRSVELVHLKIAKEENDVFNVSFNGIMDNVLCTINFDSKIIDNPHYGKVFLNNI